MQGVTNSSVSTLRRDLNELAEAELLRRVHGGAELLQDLSEELSFSEKSAKNVQEKQKIAESALKKVHANDVIFLDAGTTTGAMIDGLRYKKGLTVVTNSVTHASRLMGENLTVIILGGIVRQLTDSVVGAQALAQLSNYRFNQAFIGANAFDNEKGAMTPDPEEAAIKAKTILQAETSYLLIDSSKVGLTSFVTFANSEDVEVLTEK